MMKQLKIKYLDLQDKAVLTVLTKIMDDESISFSSTLYKAIKACIEELSDDKIKAMLPDYIFDDCSPEALYTIIDGKRFYCSTVDMAKALDSEHKTLAENAVNKLRKNCTEIRNYIRTQYGF